MSLAAFHSLELQVRRRVSGLMYGDNEGIRLGPGSVAEEVVRYQPGDDVRRIDWNVTARSMDSYVWRPRADHELETWVLLDETPSMAFGTDVTEKGDLAAQVAGAIGLLTDGPGNRMGIARLTVDGMAYSRPLASRKAARRAVVTPDRPARDGVAEVDLTTGLDELSRRARRPGLRIVVSDLLGADGTIERPFAWERALRRMAVRNQVVVVEIIDPRDLSLPDVGHLVLVDPESGRQREISTSDRRTRAAFDSAAQQFRIDTTDAVRAAGCQHVVLRTDQDWLLGLARFVQRWNRS
ncbi:DUF58 domain-containing protein [Williamsia sp.]|uniref:DUF58 domain-containing protein n=1 Tax=Williamsia sp. TaxID=1872085 RepID=UPI001A241D74|nr:DUF58 domain-containing protein [Williamsia sp.]MBJ7289369.1 DUF58 domain-containing protein [Williamsia sp.]